jgi:uncharacterized lipoprotein YddW (UPF0748 family)
MLAAARSSGFNTLFVQVRGRGDAYYKSAIEPRAAALAARPAAFDPLDDVLRGARAAGLSVHAWINVNLVADAADLPADRRHLIYRHPDWLMLPSDLADLGADPRAKSFLQGLAAWTKAQSAAVEGLYVSPIADDAVHHIVHVVGDLVSRYPVDGVHFDYVRYPGQGFDYSRQALQAFRHEMSPHVTRQDRRALDGRQRSHPLAWVERYPDRWAEFRRARLTGLLRQLKDAVRQKRPGAVVSAAVVPDAAVAAGSRFQDWPAWLSQGLIDAVCPMAYTDDALVFRRQIERAREAARGRLLWAGIGAYRLTGDQTLAHIEAARGAGADGVLLFSYDSLTSPARGANQLTRIGRQAFGQ